MSRSFPEIVYQLEFLRDHWLKQRILRTDIWTQILHANKEDLHTQLEQFIDYIERDMESPVWREYWRHHTRLPFLTAKIQVLHEFDDAAKWKNHLWRLSLVSNV